MERNLLIELLEDGEKVSRDSRDITRAAIGKRAKRNHEAGMLVWGETIMQAPLNQFEKAWNDPDILKHTWKRFATKAKEFLRKD